jgi:hypothetical protein
MEKVMACGTIASGDCHKLATRTRVPKRKGVAGATLDLAGGVLGSGNCHVYLMAGAMLLVVWATSVALLGLLFGPSFYFDSILHIFVTHNLFSRFRTYLKFIKIIIIIIRKMQRHSKILN